MCFAGYLVGEEGKYKNYIKNSLPKNISPEFIYKKNSPTIEKKRYVETHNNTKVIGVYNLNDEFLSKSNEQEFSNKLSKLIPRHDLIVVMDYGHGLISKSSANLICKKSKYLSLNAQINSSNVSFHTLRHYKNIDCVVINENELRHELRNRDSKLEILMKELTNRLNISNLVVTRGSNGATLYSKKKNYPRIF